MPEPTRRAWPILVIVSVIACVAFASAGCGSQGSSTSSDGAGNAAPGVKPKITVSGDSISVGLGAALRPVVGSEFEVKVIGEEGSGLARPDRFDWPKRLEQLAREFPPTILVFSVGSNDAQDLTDASGKVVVPFTDTTRWDAEYSRRLAASFDAFAATNTVVVWAGHVRTRDDRVGAVNRRIHRLAIAVAATRPFVRTTDLAELLGTGEGRADRCLVSDGLHLTTACLDESATKLSATLPR